MIYSQEGTTSHTWIAVSIFEFLHNLLGNIIWNKSLRALMCRHNRLKGTPSDVAPILWQYGALARLKKGETIDKLLYNGYSTISLGYAGLCVPGISPKRFCRHFANLYVVDSSGVPYKLKSMLCSAFHFAHASFICFIISSANGVA